MVNINSTIVFKGCSNCNICQCEYDFIKISALDILLCFIIIFVQIITVDCYKFWSILLSLILRIWKPIERRRSRVFKGYTQYTPTSIWIRSLMSRVQLLARVNNSHLLPASRAIFVYLFTEFPISTIVLNAFGALSKAFFFFFFRYVIFPCFLYGNFPREATGKLDAFWLINIRTKLIRCYHSMCI